MAMSLQQQAQSQPMAQQLQQQPQAQQRPQQQQEQQEQQQQQQRGVSFGSLMPYLTNLVPPDQNVQLTALYQRMKSSEITRQDFVRGARVIAGEKLIMEALRRMNLGRPVRDPVPPQPQPQVQLQQQQQPQQQLQHAQPQPSTSDVQTLSNKRPPGSEPTMVQASSSGKKAKLDPVHSLEQINDVTAVGGVNLKEEEERLLTAPKEESRTTAEMRRRFMEEDGRFFLEKGPLHSKVQEIAAKAGLKSISEDVEKCLSMSAEEWLWNFLHKSVRASKQRCDVEKDRHRVMVSLDFQKQIVAMRKEQLEFRQRKQAEEERQRKLNEEKNAATEDAKDGTGAKSQKSQQQDDKMRTTAANIAARKAVGADDVLSKWMLMAEQQQRQSNDTAWGVQRLHEQVTSPGSKALAGSTPRVNARRSALPPVARASRSIMLKDLVACLEREPGMCKSPLLYRLYEKLSSTEVSQP